MMDASQINDPSSPAASGVRDGAGRFGAGNRFGRGNPSSARRAHWQRVIDEAISDDDMRRVVDACLKMAESGDAQAIKQMSDWTVGRPVPLPEERDTEDAPLVIGPPLPPVGAN